MLRRSCQTARMDDLASRLRDAGTALLGLRDALVAGEPWPLSAAYGTEPEADWGPREVLAHVNEMLPYWTEQFEAILAAPSGAAVPFGRVASDAVRVGRIGRDRDLPSGELLDGITGGLDRASAFLAGLSPVEGERLGLHSTLGEITVRAAAERFLVTHVEDHVTQLRSILAARTTG